MSRIRSFALSCLLLGGLAPATALAHPGSGIGVDGRGRVFFVDTGGGIFRIVAPGQLAREPGPAFHWMTIDPEGRFAKTALPSTADAEMRAVGADPTLVLSSDFPVVTSEGALFYPQLGGDQRVRIERLTPDGRRSVLATLPATTESGPLRWLGGLAAGPDGSLYYSEESAVRRVARGGALTTIAGGVSVPGCVKPPGYAPDSRPHLRGLAVTPDGTVYVAASACSALLRITPRGEVTVLARTEKPWSPTGVAVAGGDVYVLEYLHTDGDDRREWLPRVRRISRDGKVAVLAAIEHR